MNFKFDKEFLCNKVRMQLYQHCSSSKIFSSGFWYKIFLQASSLLICRKSQRFGPPLDPLTDIKVMILLCTECPIILDPLCFLLRLKSLCPRQPAPSERFILYQGYCNCHYPWVVILQYYYNKIRLFHNLFHNNFQLS